MNVSSLPAHVRFSRERVSKKRLWENCLPDEAVFYSDKLYRSLQLNTSPFLPYAQQ
jgi:hypothetical protein